MTEKQKLEWIEIFGAIEKVKESQIKLHAIFKGEKNENTKQQTETNNQVNN